MKKHRNIPIFIPHLGCPNMCVFCNQRKISGKQNFERENVKKEIEQALDTIPADTECEIAYFGGSFTGIDRELMIWLLDVAKYYVERPNDGRARICGIRMSTRPDYISPEIIEILSRYPVATVELGIQSMDDSVLKLCRRGHTADDTRNACRMIREAGYLLVGQMMIGLPGADISSEIETAESICAMGASECRIYPTVVFRDTELGDMMNAGEYKALELDDAVTRCKSVLEVFSRHGVECIRLGLCASDNLSDSGSVIGGCNHPAIGDLVKGEIYFDRLRAEISEISGAKDILITVPRGEVSSAVGQHKKNFVRLRREFGLSSIKVEEGDSFSVKEIQRCT